MTVLLLPLAEMKWLMRYAAERYCRFVLSNSRTTDAADVCGLVGVGVADRNVNDDAISL